MKRYPWVKQHVWTSRAAAAILVCALLTSGARADEIHLKDGSKIDGTIVGYEGNSFKVQTSYGFALVRKDSIAEIIPSDAKQSAASNTAPTKSGTAASPGPGAVTAIGASGDGIVPLQGKPSPAAVAQQSAATQQAANSLVIAAAAPVAPRAPAFAPSAKPVPPPAVKAASLPATPEGISPSAPVPPTIKELLRANLYINQTFGFRMYTPPGWQLIGDASKVLPNTIAAVGTSDETALLVIGRDIGRESLDAHAFSTDHNLRGIYENYRLESTTQTTVAGMPAIEQHASGVADGRDWSVVLVTFGRGGDIFTIMGMTYENSDLIQIQQNVLAKMIASLRFDGAP